MPLRKIGSWVKVPDEKICQQRYSSWPSTRIFKITSIFKSCSGIFYYRVYSYSEGLRASEVVTATPKEVKEHLKLYREDGTPRKRTIAVKKEVTRKSKTEIFKESFLESPNAFKINSNSSCPNKNCEGGVIVKPVSSEFSPLLCKKCNPSPRTKATFNAETYPVLYSYLIWCNYHENLWYAIPRNEVSKFFSGKDAKRSAIKAHDFLTLLSKVK